MGIETIAGNIARGVLKNIPIIGGILDSVVTDDKERLEAKLKVYEVLTASDAAIAEAGSRAIVAEAQGQSWLQRNWRPLLMCTFMLILVNNYIIVPYLMAFGLKVVALPIPDGMWGLLTVGVGGYVAGRSWEKVKGGI